MQFKWRSRYYSGVQLSPVVKIKTIDNLNLTIASVSWGDHNALPDIESEIERFLAAAQADLELTTPFERMGGLTQEGNSLRVAMQLANDHVLRSFNTTEYREGYELCLIWCKDRIASIAMIGELQVFTLSTDQGISPLLSVHSPKSSLFPQILLGVEPNIDVKVFSCPLSHLSEIYVSHGLKSLPNLRGSDTDFESLYKQLAGHQSQAPFWLANGRL